MNKTSAYDLKIGDSIDKSDLPKDLFYKHLENEHDHLELLLYNQTNYQYSGFRFFGGFTYVMDRDEDPKTKYLEVFTEGSALHGGLKHLITHWSWINWDLKDEYFELLKQLEDQLCADYVGLILSEEEFQSVMTKLGFVTVGSLNEN